MGAVNIDFVGRDRINSVVEGLNRRLDDMDAKLMGAARTSAAMGDTFDASITSAIARWGGLTMAITAATRALDNYQNQQVAAADATADLAEAATAFLDQQERLTAGPARLQQIMALGAQYGYQGEDLRAVIDAVSALQAARGGDFQQGLISAQFALIAAQMGTPLPAAIEAERLGPGFGAAPGEMGAMARIVAQMSAVPSAAAVAPSIPQMGAFDDITFAMASVGALAAKGGLRFLPTLTGRLAAGLAPGQEVDEYLQAQGITTTTRLERLRALNELGMNTESELMQQVGVAEKNERMAIRIVVNEMGLLEKIRGRLAEADPAVLPRRLQEIGDVYPALAQTQALRASRARTQQQLFVDPATQQQELEVQQRLEAFGQAHVGPIPLVSPQGEPTWWGRTLAAPIRSYAELQPVTWMVRGLMNFFSNGPDSTIASPEAE